MILSIPIANSNDSSYITVTRGDWERSKNRVYPSVTASPSGGCFLVNDGFQTVMCTLEPEDTYRVHGTFFFRQNRHDSPVLSFIDTNQTVSDFDSLQHSKPTSVSVRNIHISGLGEIVHVSFLSPDKFVLVASGGCIGFVITTPQSCISTGYSARFSNLCDIMCGCGVPDSPFLVVLTLQGICGVVDVNNSVLLSLTRQNIILELGPPTSCAAFLENGKEEIHILATFPSTQVVQTFSVSKQALSTDLEDKGNFAEVFFKPHPLSSYAYSYVNKFGTSFLVTSVWRDIVQFSVWNGEKLRNKILLKNEMSVPYVSGLWVGNVFVIARADGMVLPFSVRFDEGKFEELEVIPQKHIALTSSCCTFIHGNSDYFLLLSLINLESLWNGTPGGICVTDSNNQNHLLKLCEERQNKTDTLLIDITFFCENIAVISVKRSGDCLAFVPSGNELKTLFLAHENEAESVTSCLLYKRQENIFVTGHVHGGIHVWVSGKKKSVIDMVHTGVVDKIIYLTEGNEQLECDFISVCTERGTVALHHFETFQCTRILQAPCTPLTSLIWDQQAECAFMVSGNIGNLWHIPTCRLERVFYASSLISKTSGYRDLLACSSNIDPITVDRIYACGDIHFSLTLNIFSLVDILIQHTASNTSPACRLALSVLFCNSPSMNSEFPELLNLSKPGLGGGFFEIGTLCAGQSAKYLLAIILLIEALKKSPELTCSIDSKEMKALCESMVNSGHVEQAPEPEDVIIQALPLLLRLPEVSRKAIRALIRVAGEQLTSTQVLDLLEKLHHIASDESSVSRLFNISKKMSDMDMCCYKMFIQVVVLSELKYDNNDNSVNCTIEKLRTIASEFTEFLVNREERSSLILLLYILREYYHYLAVNILNNTKEIVDAIGTLAFEKEGEVCNAAVKTLVSIATVEGKGFFDNRMNQWYNEKRSWRPRIITFFGNFIESVPVQSYSFFSIMMRFFLRALDPHNPNKEERNSCVMPVTHVIRLAVVYLPNVSFQQHLQYLAVGNKDGVVQVVNMKTTGIVASFHSHKEGILCVSYSSNTSSHDIAVLGENMETVKIWRANRTGSVLSAIFAGPMVEFRLRFTVDIPKFDRDSSKDSEHLSLITKCRLRWLSPHCVELSSPWHDRIQLSVQ
ncbi:uncharacterized protein TM35_000141100 [Trypanosoma theileri]|uniref:Uncharacterized protein n=1 Tax=Trypanosoma theileri TaxID=67003 RepID=A0A1X0NXF3_9TRYP|nr:uncharacterized protein TM35_000141100 [Trypanosoma theileri]ORC88899.1 hypothetical protein TM35_000141100 [Trypanosoma theileri]